MIKKFVISFLFFFAALLFCLIISELLIRNHYLKIYKPMFEVINKQVSDANGIDFRGFNTDNFYTKLRLWDDVIKKTDIPTIAVGVDKYTKNPLLLFLVVLLLPVIIYLLQNLSNTYCQNILIEKHIILP